MEILKEENKGNNKEEIINKYIREKFLVKVRVVSFIKFSIISDKRIILKYIIVIFCYIGN